jgi:hypothetical protein
MQRIFRNSIFIASAIVLLVIALFKLWPAVEERTKSNSIPGSCTIFMASFGDKVLFGNNEDYHNPKTYIWVEPGDKDNYGRVCFGFDNYSLQGGINEKGLSFDANGLPKADLNPHPELPASPYEWAVVTIMKKAATVEEAIDIASRYRRENWSIPMSYQIILADAKGDAVVISAGPDGELAFTRKKEGDGFFVSTNFNRANPENAYSYPCRRYNKAVEMLRRIKHKDDLTVEYFRSILDAVHSEGPSNNTLYSNIFDLRKGIIYLYHWHQFEEVVKLEVAGLLAEGKKTTRIRDLFSQETVKKAEDEYQKYQKRR